MASRQIICGQNSYKISYEIKDRQGSIPILILHGWGANKELMMGAFAEYFSGFKAPGGSGKTTTDSAAATDNAAADGIAAKKTAIDNATTDKEPAAITTTKTATDNEPAAQNTSAPRTANNFNEPKNTSAPHAPQTTPHAAQNTSTPHAPQAAQLFCQIYLDLPGFGASSEPAEAVDSAQTAAIVRAFLKEIGTDPKIIIGHSFGGKIAALLDPKMLVLLSSAGIIAPKRLAVRLKIALFSVLKRLGLGRFWRLFATDDAKNMSRIMYETLKIVIAEDFSGIFRARAGRTLIFWGKEDAATPLKSGQKIASLISQSHFMPLDGDHFFFLKHAKMITRRIADEAANLAISDSAKPAK